MHPLHDYLAKQFAAQIEKRGVVVWYDPRGMFRPFVAELRKDTGDASALVTHVNLAGKPVHVAEFRGSFFELRHAVEPLVQGEKPKPLLIYVAGVERDLKGSLLMELEKAGHCDDRPLELRQVARNVLRQRYTDGVIDDMLRPEALGYADIARLTAVEHTGQPASMLRTVFPETATNEAMIAMWLASDTHDAAIHAKDATTELRKLIQTCTGLPLDTGLALEKMRRAVVRYVLASEFRADLQCPAPPALAAVAVPKGQDELDRIRDIARRLRTEHADVYEAIADRVERELELQPALVPSGALGAIDTFRFEERALLQWAGDLVADGRYADALAVVEGRQRSYWLDRLPARKAQWEAVRRMADLGAIAAEVRGAMGSMNDQAPAWVDAYARTNGWYRLDLAQRRLETWVATLEDEPESERALGHVRQAYEQVAGRMADGFFRAFKKSAWQVPGVLAQTRVWTELVASRPRPVAFFMVDAMRFEMGVELVARLPQALDITIKPVIAALPTITPVGMAALLPGAAASFTIMAHKDGLGARIEDKSLPNVDVRRKYVEAKVPDSLDMTLDVLVSMTRSKLAKKVQGRNVVIVRSQEIDKAGEDGFSLVARRLMDGAIDNLARAIRALAAVGIEHFVLSADHGHLFFPTERDESMRVDAPGGKTADLHRRCWIGQGGKNPNGAERVRGAELGYDTDLDVVFPVGLSVFRAGGDLAYYHGGPSLQELVVPAITLRMSGRDSQKPKGTPVTITELPAAVKSRMVSASIAMQTGANLDLFGDAMTVRPVLMSGTKQVGAVSLTGDPSQFDQSTGCIKLMPGRSVRTALRLVDDCSSLRIVVQDPTTDEILGQTADLPVQLMM